MSDATNYQMLNPNTWTAGVDWITATTSDGEMGMRMLGILKEWSKRPGHSPLENWRNQWYVGYKTDGMRWGYSLNINSYIVIATGPTAQETWMKVFPVAKNVSRIDLQMTFKLAVPEPDLAKQMYEYMEDKYTGRISKWRLVQGGNKGGDTLYVGSRQSEVFRRYYDKGAQMGVEDNGVLWRFELELTGSIALRVAQALDNIVDVGKNPSQAIAEYVGNDLRKIGMSSPDWIETDGSHMQISAKVRTKRDRKIEWLRTQVRPTVQRLIAQGNTRLVNEALGLDIVSGQPKVSDAEKGR